MIKSFKDFTKESVELAEPAVKPKTTPKTAPVTKPGKPSPYRKDKPSVVPGPKASAEDVANKFLNLTENDKSVSLLLNKIYNSKNESVLNEELREGPQKTNRKIVTTPRPKVAPAPQHIREIEYKDGSSKIKTKNQTFKVEFLDEDIHISNTYGGGFIYIKDIEDLNELYFEIKKRLEK